MWPLLSAFLSFPSMQEQLLLANRFLWSVVRLEVLSSFSFSSWGKRAGESSLGFRCLLKLASDAIVGLGLPQVEEAVRLVRAAADHEKLRQEHLRRMKTLKAQLESLEGTKG